MNKLILTKLPKNLNQKEIKPFLKRIKYKMPNLKVRVLKNVFLTHGGILLKNTLQKVGDIIGQEAEIVFKENAKNILSGNDCISYSVEIKRKTIFNKLYSIFNYKKR